MRRLAVLLWVLGVAGLGRADGGAAGDGRYAHASRPFSLRPPAGYREVAAPASNILVQWVEGGRGLSVAVAHSRVDTSAWKSSSRLTMRLAVEAGMRVATKGFTRIASRTFDHGELPAMEIEYEFLNDSDAPIRTVMRYYFTGDGQYMALAMGPPADFAAARAELVGALDSFELKASWRGGFGRGGGMGAQQLGMMVGLGAMSAIALLVFVIARSGTRRAGPARSPYGPPVAYGPPPYGPPPYPYPPPPPRPEHEPPSASPSACGGGPPGMKA